MIFSFEYNQECFDNVRLVGFGHVIFTIFPNICRYGKPQSCRKYVSKV